MVTWTLLASMLVAQTSTTERVLRERDITEVRAEPAELVLRAKTGPSSITVVVLRERLCVEERIRVSTVERFQANPKATQWALGLGGLAALSGGMGALFIATPFLPSSQERELEETTAFAVGGVGLAVSAASIVGAVAVQVVGAEERVGSEERRRVLASRAVGCNPEAVHGAQVVLLLPGSAPVAMTAEDGWAVFDVARLIRGDGPATLRVVDDEDSVLAATDVPLPESSLLELLRRIDDLEAFEGVVRAWPKLALPEDVVARRAALANADNARRAAIEAEKRQAAAAAAAAVAEQDERARTLAELEWRATKVKSYRTAVDLAKRTSRAIIPRDAEALIAARENDVEERSGRGIWVKGSTAWIVSRIVPDEMKSWVHAPEATSPRDVAEVIARARCADVLALDAKAMIKSVQAINEESAIVVEGSRDAWLAACAQDASRSLKSSLASFARSGMRNANDYYLLGALFGFDANTRSSDNYLSALGRVERAELHNEGEAFTKVAADLDQAKRVLVIRNLFGQLGVNPSIAELQLFVQNQAAFSWALNEMFARVRASHVQTTAGRLRASIVNVATLPI